VSGGDRQRRLAGAPAELTVALILAARRNVPLEPSGCGAASCPARCRTPARQHAGHLAWERSAPWWRKRATAGDENPDFRRESSASKARDAGYAIASSKQQLFEQSDVLSMHVRLNAQTRGIVAAADLGE